MSNINNIEPNDISLSEGNIPEKDEQSNTNIQNNIGQDEDFSSPQDDDTEGNIPLPDKYNIEFIYLCKLFAKLGTLKPKEKVKCVKKFIEHFFKDSQNLLLIISYVKIPLLSTNFIICDFSIIYSLLFALSFTVHFKQLRLNKTSFPFLSKSISVVKNRFIFGYCFP